jgi:hypothetical protein
MLAGYIFELDIKSNRVVITLPSKEVENAKSSHCDGGDNSS